MSKCDIHIELANNKTDYIAGDRVQGRVRVTPNVAVNAKRVLLIGRWATHGAGNVAKGDYYSQTMHEGPLDPSKPLEFNFDFPAPAAPLSYRGNYLNIEHYVVVQVEVPWAFDPIHQIPFQLHPSTSSEASATTVPSKPTPAPANTVLGIIFGIIFLVFGLLFIWTIIFGIIFGGLGLFILYMTFRNIMAQRVLGEVLWNIEPTSVTPGQPIVARIICTPKSRSHLEKVTVKLSGVERCVSGSGSNRKTHTFKLFEREEITDSNVDLVPGKETTFQAQFELPETSAYSVKLGDNEIIWSAEAHIYIPRWPDWVDTRVIQLTPGGTGRASATPMSSVTSTSGRTNEVLPTNVASTTTYGTMPPVDSSSQNYRNTDDSYEDEELEQEGDEAHEIEGTLLEAADLISHTDRYGKERTEMITQIGQFEFPCEIIVDSVSTTFQSVDDPAYDEGVTVTGMIAGSSQRVSIQISRIEAGRTSEVYSGDLFNCVGRVIGYDDIAERLELRGRIA